VYAAIAVIRPVMVSVPTALNAGRISLMWFNEKIPTHPIISLKAITSPENIYG
jgi:hypothetical protein